MDKAHRPASQSSETRSTGFGEIEEIEDEVGRQYTRFNNFERLSSSPPDHHYLMDTQ